MNDADKVNLSLPPGWVTESFEEALVKVADRDHYTPEYVKNGIPIISPKDFGKNDKISFSNCKYITLQEHQHNRKKTDLAVGDIVFTRIGARLGKACLVTENMPEFSILHSAAQIRTNIRKVLPAYFLYFLKSDFFQSQIGKEIQSIGVPDLGLDKIYGFIVFYPSRPEQRKIARILTTIDTVIERTEQLIAKYEAIKQGLMQDLFTRGVDEHGKLRPSYEEAPHLYHESPLGWIPNGWEMVACESLCKEIVVGIVIKPTQYYLPNGIVPLLRSANIKEDGIDASNLVFTSEALNHQLQKSIVHEGDLVTVRTGYPGTTCVISKEFNGANCVDIIISRPTSEISSQFLSMWINSDFGKQQVLRKQGGLAQQHFNVGELKKLLVVKPTLGEQIRIEKRYQKLSMTIKKEGEYLAKLKLQKRGLMQDLLTGRVRVNVDDNSPY